jgi:hypothetical protein
MAVETVTTIAQIDVNRTTQVQVSINKMTGRGGDKFAVDVRRWYLDDTDEWAPTSKGISIPVEKFNDVLDALTQAEAEVDQYLPADKPGPTDEPSKARATKTPAKKKAAARKAPARRR